MKTIRKYSFVVLSIMFFLIFNSCFKDEICSNSQKGKLINLTSFDGCGWIIELEDGQNLEPLNLDDFDLSFEDGLNIWISCHKVSGGSYCMVGDIIEIDCITER